MPLRIGKPYKIVTDSHRRYAAHYNIPPEECLIVPTHAYGDESLCDVRWEDANGVLQVMTDKMFVSQNLEPLNAMGHEKLFEIWQHYYNNDSSFDTSVVGNL